MIFFNYLESILMYIISIEKYNHSQCLSKYHVFKARHTTISNRFGFLRILPS